MKSTLRNNDGIALLIVLMVMVLLLSMTGASLLFTSINFRSANNHRLSTSTFQAADAGIQHALAVIPSGENFSYTAQTTLINSYSFVTGYTYTVTALNDSASTGGNTRAILTSTAQGPNGTRKVILAYVGREASGGGDGAIYIPGSAASIETNFTGNSFLISGNDTNYDGSAGPGPAKAGISVADSALNTEMTNSTTSDGGLASNQMDNVVGAGGTPSVSTVTPPAMTPTQIADSFLTNPHTDLAGGTYAGIEIWGTDLVPRITQINGDTRISGTIIGSGVLIIDGTVEIPGTINWHGLIIARGPIQVEITGNVNIYGGIMLAESTSPDGGTEFRMGGNGNIYYSSQAFNMLNTLWPNVFTKRAKLVAWQERFE